jgi:hypothetical protein
MTILKSILEHGYFPKELPPAFFTEAFAAYASTKRGRAAVNDYKASEGFTECVGFDLALPGVARRPLRIPHPVHFVKLAGLTSKNFKRLLAKAASPFSKSRPVYSVGRFRAINPNVRPSNLARERAASRGGASHLVKLDVNHFYPSLYTHAVGWAVDPRLRSKKHWKNFKLLGKQLDQVLMDMQGKVSQGIPIGTDVSFLLGEVVLAQIDRHLTVPPGRCYRWFDDFEIACDSREQAEAVLAALIKALRSFNLRPNAKKTQILNLPLPSQEDWQHAATEQLRRRITTPNDIVAFFDSAFRIREQFPESPVLLYALGSMFKIVNPGFEVGRVAQSGISQALLAEPGAAQKAFALLTYWSLNGFPLDRRLMISTINQMIHRHAALGVSSDVAWALAFAIEQGMELDAKAAKVLAGCEDDCVLVLALDAHARGLIPKGFSLKRVDEFLASATLDGEHWMVAYESVRQGFRTVCERMVGSNPLFAEMLARKITFYRQKLPTYASVIHQGGAPEWVVARWLDVVAGKVQPSEAETKAQEKIAVVAMLREAVPVAVKPEETPQEAVATLLDAAQQSRSEVERELSDYEPYAV